MTCLNCICADTIPMPSAPAIIIAKCAYIIALSDIRRKGLETVIGELCPVCRRDFDACAAIDDEAQS